MPKQKKHAYFLYMLDYKRKEEAKGVIFRNGLRDVQTAASASWQTMPEIQRAKYKEREKKERLKDTGRPANILTAQGVCLSNLKKNQSEMQQAKSQMIKQINKIISDSYINNSIPEQKFYLINVNYFVEMQNKFVVPAEIALCEFSLKYGVTNKYHSFINPGELPIGHAYSAQSHTESTHKLPLPPNALGERNFGKICCDIVQFILTVDRKSMYPVFCRESNTDHVKSVLQQFALQIGENKDCFEVYSLEYLLYALKKSTISYAECQSETNPFKNVFMAKQALDRDPYSQRTRIACERHEELDNREYCPLSFVTRWAYQIADYCCLDLAISMIPGEHGPWDMDTQLRHSMVSCKDTTEIDYDEYDTKSNITFTDKSSTSTETNITQPRIEMFKGKIDEYDEESLWTIPHTKSADPWRKLKNNNTESFEGNASGSSRENQQMKIKEGEKNRWSIRNESKPKLPTKDSFSFS